MPLLQSYEVYNSDVTNNVKLVGEFFKGIRKPTSAKPLHSKLMFKMKLDADGGIKRFKARLVACGTEQEAEVNYSDTFAPVLDLATARMVLALSVIWHCLAYHGHIPVAYTNAPIECTVTRCSA